MRKVLPLNRLKVLVVWFPRQVPAWIIIELEAFWKGREMLKVDCQSVAFFPFKIQSEASHWPLPHINLLTEWITDKLTETNRNG